MNSFNKKLCATVLLSCGIFFSVQPSTLAASSISDLEEKKNNIQTEASSTEGKLKENQNNKNTTIEKISRLNESIQKTEKNIYTLKEQVSVQEKVIADKNAEIKILEEKYAERKKTFQDRLNEIYKNGDISYLEVLMKAESFKDFLTRFEYMGFIAAKDQSLLIELENIRIQLEMERQNMEQEKNHLEALKSEQIAIEANLKTEKGAQEDFYSKLEKDEASLKQVLAEQQAQANNVAAEIYRLQLQEEARRQQAAASAASPSGVTSVASYSQNAGSVLWPVPGYNAISSPFGYRMSPIYGMAEFHLGVDIPAPSGTPIVAVQDGTVMMSNSDWSYGNNVVIYHGNGMSTLSAHMSGFNCYPGQQVKAGDVVGYVGSTGASTGAHLHFEVHINGQRVNPSAYIGG